VRKVTEEELRVLLQRVIEGDLTVSELERMTREASSDRPASDIQEMLFAVLLEYAKSGNADKKALMKALKRANATIAVILTVLAGVAWAAFRRPCMRRTQQEFPVVAHSEMGEMESLRLQMAMDRMSKMTSTLSNLLKKITKTSAEITKNLK
jgi:hypothetical protein